MRIIPKVLRAVLQPPAVTHCILDKKSSVCSGTQINFSSLGGYSYVGHDCFVVNSEIDKFVSIADNCRIGGAAHKLHNVSLSPVFHNGKNVLNKCFANIPEEEPKKTVICPDVWIGASSVIISGVTIGTGAVVGAGSVVTHDIPPYEIWAGCPARKINCRFDAETVTKLLELKWWDWSDEMLYRYGEYFSSPKELFEVLDKG